MSENIVCKYCQSENVVKFGSYKGIQRYWCKDCQRKFKADDTLFHMKTPPEQISSALSMYYSGMSINDIRSHLRQEKSSYPSSKSVYGWIEKYTGMAVKAMKDYRPKVGSTWVADETVLEIDGQNVWMYDIIDEKTRFLLATRLALSRTSHDAQRLMEEASKKAGGRIPDKVITDKNTSYLDGIRSAFGDDTEHIRSRPFALEENTQLIERFHGTLKERTKVMRGLKNIETAIQFLDGFLVHYNYFRPHESLGGKTPAEVAGIDYEHKNWAEVIRQPISKAEEILSHRIPEEKPIIRYRLPETHIGRPRKRLKRTKRTLHRRGDFPTSLMSVRLR